MAGKKTQNGPVGSRLSGNVSDSSSNNKEQDGLLPIANVGRIMKKSLPANAKISKEAKETVQECVSEFISIITGEASDKCQREKRKTVNGDDLLWAMTTLGFENYVSPLKLYLSNYGENKGAADCSSRSASMEGDHGNSGSQQMIFQRITDHHHHSIPATPSRVMSPGDDHQSVMISAAYHHDHIAKIHQTEGNASRVLMTNLHPGVGW